MLSMKKILFWLALCGAAFAQPVVSTARLDQLVVPVPQGWYQVHDSAHGEKLVLASNDPESAQVVLLVTRAPAHDRTLQGVLKAEKTYVVTRMDGVLAQTGPTTVAEQPAIRLDYSGASSVAANGRRDFQRTVVQKDDQFYILQAIAADGQLSEHASTMEAIYADLSWSDEPLDSTASLEAAQDSVPQEKVAP